MSNRTWANKMISEEWIPQNWEECRLIQNNIKSKIGNKISERGGKILEIGAGPGGGFMPYILTASRSLTYNKRSFPYGDTGMEKTS